MERISVRLNDETLEALDSLDISRSEFIRTWVREGLSQRDLPEWASKMFNREQLKRENKPQQLEVYFKHNVRNKIIDMFSNDVPLRPENAMKVVSGYWHEVVENNYDESYLEFLFYAGWLYCQAWEMMLENFEEYKHDENQQVELGGPFTTAQPEEWLATKLKRLIIKDEKPRL